MPVVRVVPKSETPTYSNATVERKAAIDFIITQNGVEKPEDLDRTRVAQQREYHAVASQEVREGTLRGVIAKFEADNSVLGNLGVTGGKHVETNNPSPATLAGAAVVDKSNSRS